MQTYNLNQEHRGSFDWCHRISSEVTEMYRPLEGILFYARYVSPFPYKAFGPRLHLHVKDARLGNIITGIHTRLVKFNGKEVINVFRSYGFQDQGVSLYPVLTSDVMSVDDLTPGRRYQFRVTEVIGKVGCHTRGGYDAYSKIGVTLTYPGHEGVHCNCNTCSELYDGLPGDVFSNMENMVL